MSQHSENEASTKLLNQYTIIILRNGSDGLGQKEPDGLLELQGMCDHVSVFDHVDPCIDFLTDIDDQLVLLIIHQELAGYLMPHIHPVPHLKHICLVGSSGSKLSASEWYKMRGIYRNLREICDDLRTSAKHCDEHSVPFSLLTFDKDITSINLDQLEPSFMYTKLFKKIFLSMEHEEHAKKAFVDYCRTEIRDRLLNQKLLDEFDRDYQPDNAIYWYTRESFIYKILNRALRELDAEVLIEMGFFIADLHRQISRLYYTQMEQYSGQIFTVYRGQTLCSHDFQQLTRCEGGLISFNSFLSTSRKKDVPQLLAFSAAETDSVYGILFIIDVHSALRHAIFADITDLTQFPEEEEILFSMHTVFRVRTVKPSGERKRFYHVHLSLTDQEDHGLEQLCREYESQFRSSSQHSCLLTLLQHLNKPYVMSKQIRGSSGGPTAEGSPQCPSYQYLATIQFMLGNYEGALELFEKQLSIITENHSNNHHALYSCYGGIGSSHHHLGNYSQALTFHQTSLKIMKKALPSNHPNLATSYNNIGNAYHAMGDYSQALRSYQTSLEIRQRALPSNHPDLATSYNHIGDVYALNADYSQALRSYQTSLEIRKKALPSNHPDLGTTYESIGTVYERLGDYSQALKSYETSLEIRERALPSNHPDLAASHNNIGNVYRRMGDYPQALKSYQMCLEIMRKALPPNHPDFVKLIDNISQAEALVRDYR